MWVLAVKIVLALLFMRYLKNEQECIIRFKNSRPDVDQLILALKFRFGLFWFKKLDLSFSRVFIRYIKTLIKH